VKDGDSHHCEYAGIYGICVLVSVIVSHFQLTDGSIHIACDNKESLRVLDPEFYPNPQGSSFDFANAIWNMIQLSPLRWTFEHVRGHQDSNGRIRALTRLERYNVFVDRVAKNFWIHHARAPGFLDSLSPQPIGGEGWQVWTSDGKVTHPSSDNLYELLQDKITQMWWVRHNIVPKENLKRIDWDGTSRLMSSLPPAKRRYITKMASQNCGVGDTLLKWKYQADAACPRCGAHETTTHVYQCSGQGADAVWETSMARLVKYMLKPYPGVCPTGGVIFQFPLTRLPPICKTPLSSRMPSGGPPCWKVWLVLNGNTINSPTIIVFPSVGPALSG
jgi:hypothetical protein